jgi:hypothetical protein
MAATISSLALPAAGPQRHFEHLPCHPLALLSSEQAERLPTLLRPPRACHLAASLMLSQFQERQGDNRDQGISVISRATFLSRPLFSHTWKPSYLSWALGPAPQEPSQPRLHSLATHSLLEVASGACPRPRVAILPGMGKAPPPSFGGLKGEVCKALRYKLSYLRAAMATTPRQAGLSPACTRFYSQHPVCIHPPLFLSRG